MFFIENHSFFVKIIGNEIQVWISIFYDIDIYGNNGGVDIFYKTFTTYICLCDVLCKSNCFKVGVDIDGIACDIGWYIIF